jgi:hypothetical protein
MKQYAMDKLASDKAIILKDHFVRMKEFAEKTLNYPELDKDYCLSLLNQGHYSIIHRLTDKFNSGNYLKNHDEVVGLLCTKHYPVYNDLYFKTYELIIKPDVLEYIYHPRNDVIYRLLEDYTRETCPVFVTENFSNPLVMIEAIVNIGVRELPASLYIPNLVVPLVITLLGIAITTVISVYINSKSSNKNIFVFRFVNSL